MFVLCSVRRRRSVIEATALTEPDLARVPPLLRRGDNVRFVSPGSTPEKDAALQSASIVESWGLKVEYGEHTFDKAAYLAGTDEERLADFQCRVK